MDSTLKRTTTRRCEIVAANVHLEASHVASLFQIETENFTHTILVNTDGGDESLGGVSVEDKITAVSREAGGVMTSLRGVEFKRAVRLKVKRLGVVGGEKNESCVESDGMASPRER
jgi:hypothetical protein